jgi:hypothetical protein
LFSGSGYPQVIVGEKVIVVKSDYYQKIFVFDRQGDFLHGIGKIGSAPNDFARLNFAWDMSPNEKYFALSDRSYLKLHNINGELIRSCKVPEGSEFYFSDDHTIVVYKPRMKMVNDGNLIFIYNLNLDITDSLFWVPKIAKRAGAVVLPRDDFYRLGDKILFRPCDNDTMFRISPKSGMEPAYIFNFGKLKPPSRWMSPRETDSYTNIGSINETNRLLIVNLFGTIMTDNTGYEEETLIYEKRTGDYYSLAKHPASSESPDELIDIVNDLDGLDYYYNEAWLFPSVYLKTQIEQGSSRQKDLKNSVCIDQLANLIKSSGENFPILRIIHYDKDIKPRKSILKATPINTPDNILIKPVRSNHDWNNAETLADQAYDSSDDSFWLVKSSMNSIEHRSRNGIKLPDSFSLKEGRGIEAITVNSKDNSLWLADIRFDSVFHFDKSGNKMPDGFKLEPKQFLGIAFDPTDNTLWLLERLEFKLWHYSLNGEKLGEPVDILKAGCNGGRGMAYDIRDHSLWLVNAGPNKMIHINKKGEELPGSFYFDDSLSLPDGVALDYIGFEFWISDWGARTRNRN